MIYKLQPIFIYNLWGGYKLSSLFNKPTEKIGEAWILSCLKDKNSSISNEVTLKDVFLKNKDIVSKGYKGDFPLLIKLIDANDDLSIQVHPDAKTEFWHLLSNTPSKLYLGFKESTSKDEVKNILENGDITKHLNYISVSKGDSFLIRPGTIHAIGKGSFLIEIQRSADVTYRLYDFNRVDKDGHKRELHIPQALDVIKFNKYNILKGSSDGLIAECEFFHVYHLLINCKKELIAEETSFHCLTIINGSGKLKSSNDEISLNKMDTIFIPAGEGNYYLDGNMEVILTTL